MWSRVPHLTLISIYTDLAILATLSIESEEEICNVTALAWWGSDTLLSGCAGYNIQGREGDCFVRMWAHPEGGVEAAESAKGESKGKKGAAKGGKPEAASKVPGPGKWEMAKQWLAHPGEEKHLVNAVAFAGRRDIVVCGTWSKVTIWAWEEGKTCGDYIGWPTSSHSYSSFGVGSLATWTGPDGRTLLGASSLVFELVHVDAGELSTKNTLSSSGPVVAVCQAVLGPYDISVTQQTKVTGFGPAGDPLFWAPSTGGSKRLVLGRAKVPRGIERSGERTLVVGRTALGGALSLMRMCQDAANAAGVVCVDIDWSVPEAE